MFAAKQYLLSWTISLPLTTENFNETEDDIILQDWYNGERREDIETKTGRSAGYISNLVSEEKERVGEGNLDAFRRLAKELGGQQGIAKTMEGIRLANAAEREGIDCDELSASLSAIAQMQKKSGKNLKDLPLEVETRNRELKIIEETIKNKKTSAVETENKREQALSRAKQTDESLASFQKVSSVLEKLGLPMDDLEKLENVLANAKAHGHNPTAILQALAEQRDLKDATSKLRQQKAALENEIDQKNQVIQQQDARLKSNAQLLQELKETNNLGFGTSELRVVKEKVTKIAADNGIVTQEAMRKFIGDTETQYDTIAGFSRLGDTKKKELEQLENEKANLEKYCANKTAIVDSIQALHAKNVSDSEIVLIRNIIVKNGVSSLKEFEEDIMLYGDAKKAKVELEEQNREMTAANLKLKAENELIDLCNKSVKEATEGQIDSLKECLVGVTKATQNAQRSVETETSAFENKLTRIATTAEASAARAVSKIDQLVPAVTRVQQKITEDGTYMAFEVFVVPKRGQKVQLSQLVRQIVVVIDIALPQLTDLYLKPAVEYLQAAKKEIISLLETGTLDPFS